MRIRSTKPEFWRSERIARVDWEARFVLKGLESYVDDNGVGKDDLALIVGDIFSRDLAREPSRTLARVTAALNALSDAGLVHRYEVEGERLLYISFWDSVQRIDRAAAGRFPRPDGTMEYGSSSILDGIASPREPSRALATGTGEQGNRGTGEQKLSSPRGDGAAGFNEFYLAYPRKVGKEAARKAFSKAVSKGTPAAVIIEGAQRFARDPNLPPDKQFIPHPSSWLNAGRWEDEPLPPRSDGPPRLPDVDGQEWMRR